MSLSERRFDARVVAIECITRLARDQEEPSLLLPQAEQVEEWLMRDGPVSEEEPPWFIGGITDVRQPSIWDRFGRGA